jgi:hypothetical protein
MNESIIDPANLRAEIEMLQGQMRAMRCIIAALIISSPNRNAAMENIAVMQSDLLTEFDVPPQNDDHRRQLRLWESGTQGAMNDLHSRLASRGR